MPAGAAAGIGVVSSYQFALNALDLPLMEARTVAISVLVLVGLYLILALEGVGGRRGRLIGGMCLGAAARLRSGRWRSRRLASSSTWRCRALEIVATAVVGAAIAVAGLELMGLRESEELCPVLDGVPEPEVREQRRGWWAARTRRRDR